MEVIVLFVLFLESEISQKCPFCEILLYCWKLLPLSKSLTMNLTIKATQVLQLQPFGIHCRMYIAV